jgi:hypothetical protein
MLFTKDCPTEDYISKLMAPYNWENSQDNKSFSRFTWDWYEIGGRYNGKIKLKINENDKKYKWEYIDARGRNGHLFWSYLLNEYKRYIPFFREENFYNSMGFMDGYLHVDGAPVKDILNFDELSCYAFMTEDGEAYSKDWWDGETIIENKDFEDRLKSQKEKSQDLFVTIIDYHD